MKYFSIALVVLALASSLVRAQRCPLAGMETFPGINPAPAPSALTACSRYAEASCCSTGLSDDINAGNDEITRQISQFININTESQCANTVRQAACMQCAGDQYVWASDVTETRYEWRLCKSFCETLLSDCGTSTLISTGDTVSSKYQSGKAFCLDLFSASDASPYVVDDADDKQCFDPTMPPCSMNDVDSYYSTCTDNKRDLYFNWKDTNCAGGIRLPDNKNDLPCPITCGSGTYLPVGASECADCELGTTSSVKKCLTRWSTWPTDPEVFITHKCADTYVDRKYVNNVPNCNERSWRTLGDRIESGIQGKDGVTAVLQIYVNLVRDGWVSFVGTVYAETYYDRFYFRVDEETRVMLNNSVSRQSFNYSLPAGPHFLQWRYAKDDSLSYYDDKATIWDINIDGTTYAADKCIPLSQDTCSCTGNSTCDSSTYPCTANDYHWEYAPCQNDKTRKIWVKNTDSQCSDGVAAPEPGLEMPCANATCPFGSQKNVTGNLIRCNTCQAGFYALPGTGCARCEGNTFSAGSNVTSCLPCGGGTTANTAHTDCVASCEFSVPPFGPQATINLANSFWSQSRYLRRNTVDGHLRLYQVSLCSKIQSCYYDRFGAYRCDDPAYVFETDDNNIIPRRIGVNFNYTRKTEKEFSIVYTNTDEVPVDCNQRRSTFTINFACTKSGNATSSFVQSADNCNIVYNFKSSLACRRCLATDFIETPRACENGIQMVDYMLAEDAECYLDGYNMLEAKPRACETVEVKTGLAVVIALSVVIIFVALVAAVAIVYRKKRHYEQEYQRLANNKAESDDIEL
jgi:hypothetical protein